MPCNDEFEYSDRERLRDFDRSYSRISHDQNEDAEQRSWDEDELESAFDYHPEEVVQIGSEEQTDEEYEHQRWLKKAKNEQEELKKPQTCSRCWGRGCLPDGHDCPMCEGSGEITPFYTTPF
jgi:DnaJ-class molecular chaperone